MAFKSASNQRDYTLCSQFDDALDLPDVPEITDEPTPEDVAAAKKIAEEREQRLKVARERSDWPALIKPGHRAAFFHFRHIPGTAIDWWQGQTEKCGAIEAQALLFRLALRKIEGIATLEVKLVEVPTADGSYVKLVSPESMDAIYALDGSSDGIGRKVVGELASVVFKKTFRGVDPL